MEPCRPDWFRSSNSFRASPSKANKRTASPLARPDGGGANIAARASACARKPSAIHRALPNQPSVATKHFSNLGDKAKARAILDAVRLLKQLEEQQRESTEEEREVLRAFPGFGPVALSIFPDPMKDTYKPGWDSIGRELESLLSEAEYESAKRTTFNAFYTSP